MGIDQKDKEGNMDKCVDDITLRQNAGLNDIACAIRKNIFFEFFYRYDYAEDLDLGIRLLQKGYRLKFLSSEFVFHGHNRPLGYYLKRSIVETHALNIIFGKNDMPSKKISDLLGLVVAYGGVEIAISELQGRTHSMNNFGDFFVAFDKLLEHSFERSVAFYAAYCNSIEIHNETDYIIQNLSKIYIMLEDTTKSYDELHYIKYYIDNHLKTYIKKNGYVYNENNWRQVFDAVRKQLAILVGSQVGYLDKNLELYNYILNLRKGV